MESRRFEELGRGWADTAHTTDCGPASAASSVSDDSGGGWADTAHATELQLADMKGEGRFIHRGHRCSQMKEKTGRGRESCLGLVPICGNPAAHLWIKLRSSPPGSELLLRPAPPWISGTGVQRPRLFCVSCAFLRLKTPPSPPQFVIGKRVSERCDEATEFSDALESSLS